MKLQIEIKFKQFNSMLPESTLQSFLGCFFSLSQILHKIKSYHIVFKYSMDFHKTFSIVLYLY